ncbi:PLP-dependent aminotransferase family protein [Nocardioides sp. LHD-245]|uniref:aminotransferase-like domain-containing protein n=1 Tax=Nocardioides sp. LHD-245 TaxID=3051387 RepID=UPI0027E04FA6|nr:PLP-dependent aminotransferase family protein [Nocardioides sp. LHD-245]
MMDLSAALTAELSTRLRQDGERHRIVSDTLLELIRDGRIAAGQRLPAERRLATALGVSRTTVVRAYASLEAIAVLDRRVGSGSYVTSTPGAARLPRMMDLTDGTADREPAHSQGLINLSISTPAVLGEMRDAIRSTADEVFARAMLATQHTEGEPELRAWVAAWYTRRGLPTDPAQVLITAGAQQGLAMSTQLLRRRTAPFVVEAPTYLGLLDLARMRRARLLSVPALTDPRRIAAAAEHVAGQTQPLFYVMTTCHTVTGHSMPAADRELLARLVHDSGGLVVDDDILADQLFEPETAPPLAAFLDERRVITVGGTSKLLWDGLRVGWLRAPQSLIQSLVRMKSAYDLGTSVISQLVALDLLQRADEIAARRVDEARTKLELTTSLLRERMPEWRWQQPHGGRSLWVELPTGSDAARFAAQAVGGGVAVATGETFTGNGSHHDHLRLGFVQPTSALTEGLARLAATWAGYGNDADRSATRPARRRTPSAIWGSDAAL